MIIIFIVRNRCRNALVALAPKGGFFVRGIASSHTTYKRQPTQPPR